MANFPNSVTSFGSKSAGQVIQPSDVNNLQDEVTAIEDGYLNGTAPLNSSNSTVRNLSVTGKSTLASTLTIGAVPYQFPSSVGTAGQVLAIESVSGSTLRLEWRTSVPGSMPACRLSLSSAVNQATSGVLGINWTVEDADASGLHSTSASSSKVNLTSSGLWLLGANVAWKAGSSYHRLTIMANDTTALATQNAHDPLASSAAASVTALYQAGTTTTFVGVAAYADNTGGIKGTSTSATSFWAMLLSS